MKFRVLVTIALMILGGTGGTLLALRDLTRATRPESDTQMTCWYSLHDPPTRRRLLQRGRTALRGLHMFALPPSEAVYYLASTDSDGQPLSTEHIYEVTGPEPQARYWSVTLYGKDNRFVENDADIYALNKYAFGRDLADGFRFYISASTVDGPWLPCGAGGDFSLILRLYGPEALWDSRQASSRLPVIRRVPTASTQTAQVPSEVGP